MARGGQGQYRFDVNVYSLLLLIFIILASLYFLLLKFQPFYLAKYVILPAYSFYNFELNFILSNKVCTQIVQWTHLDFFLKRFYLYANGYPLIDVDTFIQVVNNFLISNKYPENLDILKFTKYFLLSNFYINIFNLIVFFPFYFFVIYILGKINKDYFVIISKRQLTKEFKEIENKAHKYNSDVDVELYVINYRKFKTLDEVEAYLVSIIKSAMSSELLYISYTKFFNNLEKLVSIINQLQEISDKNNLGLNFKKNLEKIYFNKNLKRYGIYQYWIFLMFTAKTIRNFPQANIAKQIGELTKNKELSHILKWTTTRNLPDNVIIYYFFYDLIINMEISTWVDKILDVKYKSYYEEFLPKEIKK